MVRGGSEITPFILSDLDLDLDLDLYLDLDLDLYLDLTWFVINIHSSKV